MASRPRLHCVDRAFERYGIELSWDDFMDIKRRCRVGEGRMEVGPRGQQTHALVIGERVLWVVFLPGDFSRDGRDAVLTICPPGMGQRVARRDFRHIQRRERARR